MTASSGTDVGAPWFVRACGLGLLALLAFTGTAALVRALTPAPEDFVITPKLEHLEHHVADYNLICLGSSRIHRSFIPEVFDARMAQLGFETRSFNLGGRGMFTSESDYVLRDLLAMPGLDLDYVIIEFFEQEAFWRPSVIAENRTRRQVHWHDWTATRNELEIAWLKRAPLKERFIFARSHLQLFAWRLTSYGQGWRIVGKLLGFDVEKIPLNLEDIVQDGGYQSIEVDEGDRASRQRFLDRLPSYHAYKNQLAKLNAGPGGLRQFNLAALLRQVEAVRAVGAEPIYILPPGIEATPTAYRMQAAGLLPPMLSFNNPDENPSLYRTNVRFDFNHLNHEGSIVFSRVFAEAFGAMLEARQRDEDAGQ